MELITIALTALAVIAVVVVIAVVLILCLKPKKPSSSMPGYPPRAQDRMGTDDLRINGGEIPGQPGA